MSVPSNFSTPSYAGNRYRPALWKEICAFAGALAIAAVMLCLIFLEKPILPSQEPLVRGLLSLTVSVIGATVPGFLAVDLSFRGSAIRAGGALALFVLTFTLWPLFARAPTPPTALFRLVNSQTGDPFHRPLTLFYRLKGQLEQQESDVGRNNAGRVRLEGSKRHEDFEDIRIDCDGYRVCTAKVPCPQRDDSVTGKAIASRDGEGIIRVVAKGKNGVDVRKPSLAWDDDFSIGLKEYEKDVQMEVAADEVKITCENNTGHHVQLWVHHFLPTKHKDDWNHNQLDWCEMFLCPPGLHEISGFFIGPGKGGYFAIYGSVFDLDAEKLGEGHLFLRRDNKLVIDFDDRSATRLDGELNK